MSEWIEHKGGDLPVHPDQVVEVRYRHDEDQTKGTRISWPVPAHRLAWYHDGEDDDIVAYRLVNPPHNTNSK